MPSKKPLNALGKFLKVFMTVHDITMRGAEKALNLSPYYLYKVFREPVRKLNINFMRFPEVFNFTDEETATFKKLCEEYIADRPPLDQKKYYPKHYLPKRFNPLLDALRENADNISDEKISILIAIVKNTNNDNRIN